jgi:hypothetical protein
MKPTITDTTDPQPLGVASPANIPPLPLTASLGIPQQWRETAWFVSIGMALLFILIKPAFDTYFFSENFIYLKVYSEHQNHFWRAMWSPILAIFFRPVLFLFGLPWHFILPLDPWLFHLRNFGFIAINLLLLHRILLRLITSTWARAIAFFFYVISKTHFTSVGYINLFDVIVLSFLLLGTVLFFLRFITTRKVIDYAFALLFSLFSIFSKDYGLVVVTVVATLALVYGIRQSHWRTDLRWWAWRLAPLLLMVGVYFSLRLVIVGRLPQNNPNYTPQFSPALIVKKIAVYASVLNNLTLRDNGDTGAYGLEKILAGFLGIPNYSSAVAAACCFLCLFLWAWTLKSWRQLGIKLLLPLVWVAVYIGPTLVVRNLNVYYLYEPLAGAALLLGWGISVSRASLRWVWIGVLALMALNAGLSNYQAGYHWSLCASMTVQLRQPIVEELQGQPLESITFVTSQMELWRFNLIEGGPLIPALLRRPDLKIKVVTPEGAAAARLRANANNLVFSLEGGTVVREASVESATIPHIPFIEALFPSGTRVGQAFNVQPDGQSAMAIACVNCTPTTVVMLDDLPLPTTFGNPTMMTALVPSIAFAQPGHHTIALKNGSGVSNRLEWVVQP